MPITAPKQSSPVNREFEADEEYKQLLRVVRAARGSFFLLLIESNYPPELRDRLLNRLQNDLAGTLNLRRMELTASNWEVFCRTMLETSAESEEAIVLIGLENTPGLVTEPGSKPIRPPVFAFLNRLRETLHRHLSGPLLVWCTPSIYSGLQTHAPDFFDHYTGLFQFMQELMEPHILPRTPATNGDLASRRLHTPVAAERLVKFYKEQLEFYSDATLSRVDALLGLANTLLSVGSFKTSDIVLTALSKTDEALTILSSNPDAFRWARTHVLRGTAYADLPTGDRDQNLRQAIACYEAALRVFTEQDFPMNWAENQNDIGTAYADLPTGDRDQNLRQAIACYEAALRVLTEQDFPMDWALTQGNLGIAYLDLTTGDRDQNLRQAIACHEAALRVRTEQDFPMDWATTQGNLGTVYLDLPVGNKEQNLRQAIACYEAALRVFTEQDFPMDWALTQYNLAVTINELSKECYRNAVRGYRNVGMKEQAKRIETFLKKNVRL